MADIQHSQLQDPQIHEPKGVSTAAAGSVYVADGAGSGVWTPSEDLVLPTGWGNYENSSYTSASPLALTASTRTKLTIDALGAGTNETYLPEAGSLWDNVNNKITPYTEGDMYDIRLRFKALPGVSDGYITGEVDIGGSEGVILEQTQRFLKGAVEQSMLFVATIFTLNTFIANGGSIYLESSINVDIYDIGLLINRTHKAV